MAEKGEGIDVPIFVNNVKYDIARGPETVAHIKQIGHVPSADVLEELLDGKLQPLSDTATVDVHGGEHFVSHPRTGSSS